MLIWEVFIQQQQNRKNVVVTISWEICFHSFWIFWIPQVDFSGKLWSKLASIPLCDKGKPGTPYLLTHEMLGLGDSPTHPCF